MMADIGVRGVGQSREEALQEVAVALTVVIIDPDTVICTEWVTLECASQGRDPCLWTGACGPRPATATLRQWYAATPPAFCLP